MVVVVVMVVVAVGGRGSWWWLLFGVGNEMMVVSVGMGVILADSGISGWCGVGGR